jgi:twitching motility protein PilT
MNFDALLKFCLDQKASDLHLQAGVMPMLRIGRMLRGIEGQLVTADELRVFVNRLGLVAEGGSDRDPFAESTRFVGEIPGTIRLRGLLSSNHGEPAATFRLIPLEAAPLDALGLPPIVKELTLSRRGLVVVAGEAGSGRTTTLASMIETLNAAQTARILQIENPIEYRIPSKKAMVTQQDLRGSTTPGELLDGAEAQDPDVVVVSDLASSAPSALEQLLRLARGGRMVAIGCEGSGAVNALQTLIGNASGDQRRLAAQLASTLEAVIAQRMATTRDGRRRVVVEVLRGGPLIARSISESRYDDLERQLTGRQNGMQSFDQHLAELYQAGELSGTEAMRLATNPEAIATILRGARRDAAG